MRLLLLVIISALAAKDSGPAKTMPLPENYREWVWLSSGVGMSYTPEKDDKDPGFDNVFANPEAYKSFQATGTWPSNTILMLENRNSASQSSINQSGHFQTERSGLEAHVKDQRGVWAFYSFGNGNKIGTLIPKGASCYSCHEQHAAVDTTFVQFYPTLLVTAKAKGESGAAVNLGLLLATMALAQANEPIAIQQANLGVALAKKEDYAGAIEAYKRALGIDPQLPNLYLNLGLAYFKQGSFRESLAAFQKEPRSDRTTTLIGMSLFGLGKYTEAAVTLQPLATEHPENGELGYLLAKCYLWAGQHEQSMEMFRRLLEHDPDSAPVHMLLGEAFDADDREKEATAEYEAAVKSAGTPPEAHFGLGYLYWKQKRYADAEREFEAELKMNPEHAPSLAYLGDAMLHEGRKEQAVSALKHAESLDRNAHVVHQDLGIYYQDMKQWKLALDEFQQAARTAPDNYDAHYRLARVYKQMGKREDEQRELAIVQKLHAVKDEEPLMRISGPH